MLKRLVMSPSLQCETKFGEDELRLLMDPYPYVLGWGVFARTPDGCHRLSCRLLEVEL